ncbi:MAG: hypothetical protein JW719_00345 [Pirellulales bacterium]|nr:hypothetical protein [Pirellulales bacterium]
MAINRVFSASMHESFLLIAASTMIGGATPNALKTGHPLVALRSSAMQGSIIDHPKGLLIFAWIMTRSVNESGPFTGLPLVGLGSLAVQKSIK